MKYIMKGKNTTISDAMMERAQKKVGKFEKFFRPDTDAHLTFSVEKGRSIFEVTIQSKGTFIRAEESSLDMYSSIDMAVDKLERQIRKYKTRLGKKIHQEAMIEENYDLEELIDEEEEHLLVKTKKFAFKPMNAEEAILQMNLLGHSFFVFANSENEQVNVVYKRKDGAYGIIEPEF
jgi:putative sigma-54 modulation protein